VDVFGVDVSRPRFPMGFGMVIDGFLNVFDFDIRSKNVLSYSNIFLVAFWLTAKTPN